MKAGADQLVTLSDPRSPAAEAYRTLRANLQFSLLDRPARTLLVTSAGPDEGKSATLGNLAVILAQAGTRTLAVDCDFRRPSLHRLFDLSNDKGLATALLEGGSAEPLLQATAVPDLRVLTAGPPPPNPGDLLRTPRMEQIIRELASSADLALFDAAPVAVVADAALLATLMDGVILVVSAGKTRRELASRARSMLEKANARVLGVVLNNARLDRHLYRYFDNHRG